MSKQVASASPSARLEYQPLLFWTDAGAYRAWAARTHGSVLVDGGTLPAWSRARRTIALLAAQTGLTRTEVQASLVSDYLALEGADV